MPTEKILIKWIKKSIRLCLSRMSIGGGYFFHINKFDSSLIDEIFTHTNSLYENFMLDCQKSH